LRWRQCRPPKLLARDYERRLGSAGFNLLNANGVAAEQSVPHLHFHFLPRFTHDAYSAWPELPGSDADLDELLEKLRVVPKAADENSS
jgi:histidine triad (HIT) family protein